MTRWSYLVEADDTLRKKLREIKAAQRGKLPKHIRERYDLCTCRLVTCQHCRGLLRPLQGAICENPAEVIITHTPTQTYPSGLRKRVCKACGQEYINASGMRWQEET